jgi:ubiquinone/menaquinone biosynthesis C-methylase UbiE
VERTTVRGRPRWRLPEMEGGIARWYARLRGSQPQLATYRRHAHEFTERLPEGAAVLEVAPGPGYLAVEMARTGRVRVTGLDISRTFVEIATRRAREQGVDVAFRHGDAARMPFDDDAFDLVVCQAAFKNFREPVGALDEMHRVLRPGGTAVIHDLAHEASDADIAREVNGMGISGPSRLVTRFVLRGLRRRAHSRATWQRLAAASAFGACEIRVAGTTADVRFTKAPGTPRD